MIEREFSESEPNVPAQQERFFDVEIERLLQHSPGVERSLRVLKEAQDMDGLLRTEGGNHALTRRFSIFSGGSVYHPFPHYRVELVPKHTGLSAFGVEGMMMRFAVEPKDNQKAAFSGAIAVAYGLPAGVTADYVLTDSLWQPYTSTDDLLIVDGILRGTATPHGDSDFRYEEFDSVLNDMEPALQNNTAAA